MTNTDQTKFMTLTEAARKLDLTEKTIRRYSRKGYFSGVKRPKALLLPVSEVIRFKSLWNDPATRREMKRSHLPIALGG